jgi:oligoendopeptidase F
MSEQTVAIPTRKPRRFLAEDLVIDSWESIESYLEDLRSREIGSVEELENWIKDLSELEAVTSEDVAWRYIKMTCDTTDKSAEERFNFFVQEIQPKIAPIANELDKKLLASPYLPELDEQKYFIYLRSVRNSIEMFREENIPLFSEMSVKEQQYGTINGAMTITVDGEELTMQQGAKFMKEPDREKRKEVYDLLWKRRIQDRENLHNLLDELIGLRQQIAKNAGFENYRDYKHEAMGRFDYQVSDCLAFHDSVASQVMPIVNEIVAKRKEQLGVDPLRPWDMDVDPENKPPLKPFKDSSELVGSTVEAFTRLDPKFGEFIQIMDAMKHLDLDSRMGKAPGGYNYPLQETGVPFIFMNSVGAQKDVITMVHEGGHAIHSFLKRDLELTAFKSIPSEVAELASMSMELISMDHWDTFYSDESELKRAKKEQLERVITVFPWVAAVDKFQHWLYTREGHDHDMRQAAWEAIQQEFSSNVVDWSDYAHAYGNQWQAQLHIYEVPFYYIEYGISQLGAIAMWKQYRENPAGAVANYEKALRLGYTKSIGEIYEAAGIKFDFSADYIGDLARFVKTEIDNLDQ